MAVPAPTWSLSHTASSWTNGVGRCVDAASAGEDTSFFGGPLRLDLGEVDDPLTPTFDLAVERLGGERQLRAAGRLDLAVGLQHVADAPHRVDHARPVLLDRPAEVA